MRKLLCIVLCALVAAPIFSQPEARPVRRENSVRKVAAAVGPIAANRRRSGGGGGVPVEIITAYATGPNGSTTPPVDTTGANFIYVGVSGLSNTSPITDNKGNTWSSTSEYTNVVSTRIFYCSNPIVGIGHTFSMVGTYTVIMMAAWSGMATSPYDTSNGNTTSSSTTVSTGSISPSQNNVLIVSSLAVYDSGAGTASLDGGFTLDFSIPQAGGNNFGGALANLLITNGASTNQTWTNTSSGIGLATAIAAFKY